VSTSTLAVVGALASGDYQHAAADQDGTGDLDHARPLAEDDGGEDQSGGRLQQKQQ
jgi:hypothetical protein